MREVGDYIYLVLIIIAALSSVFKKKKEKTGPSIPQPEKKIPDFKEILKEFLPEEEQKPLPQPAVLIPAEVKVAEKAVVTYENTTDYNALKAKKQVNNDIVNNQIHEKRKFSDTDLIDETPAIEFNNTDDARKAFIYSEIFNKKY